MCEIVKRGLIFLKLRPPKGNEMDCKTIWYIPVRIAEITATVRIQGTRGNQNIIII